jgi:site-specific DNA-methyltransferase (adenine-specific)/site-specific DNA-methyltransferase (cytosine-N4-specific)
LAIFGHLEGDTLSNDRINLQDINIPSDRIFSSPEKNGSAIILGDALKTLRSFDPGQFRCCVTSPPYWSLRDYGIENQIGAEPSLDEYISRLVATFREVRRVLSDDGTFWLNIGDSYTSGNRTWRDTDKKNPARGMNYRPPTPPGLKPKDLIGIPWRIAFALQQDGWYLRSDIIWYKPNCQPESVKDRPTRAHEYIFLLSKSEDYYYNHEAVRERGTQFHTFRNRRTVWSIPTIAYPGAHFATFPPDLVVPCILASTEPGDFVLDTFFGSGTVGEVCQRLNRKFIGIEVNEDYIPLAKERLGWEQPLWKLIEA